MLFALGLTQKCVKAISIPSHRSSPLKTLIVTSKKDLIASSKYLVDLGSAVSIIDPSTKQTHHDLIVLTGAQHLLVRNNHIDPKSIEEEDQEQFEFDKAQDIQVDEHDEFAELKRFLFKTVPEFDLILLDCNYLLLTNS